jgi:hypothetical protein
MLPWPLGKNVLKKNDVVKKPAFGEVRSKNKTL